MAVVQGYPGVHYRITGSTGDLCSGDTNAPNALELVKIVATTCNFTYHIKDTSFGPYLDQIGSDIASGAIGWLYEVNFISPDIGAADYQLKDNDNVFWHFNDFNSNPTKTSQDLSLSANLQGGGSGTGNDNNSSVGFTITASGDGVAFGDISKGSAYSKNVTLNNAGQTKIHVEAIVSGDEVFKNYLTLNSVLWRSYSDSLNQAQTKTIGVGLNVPNSYTSSGSKNGKLTFWAIQTN